GFFTHGTLIDFGIPPPDLFTRPAIHRKYHAPRSDAVDGVVPNQRRGFLISAAGPEHVGPLQSEPVHVGSVDLFQRAVARLALGFSISQPGARELVLGSAGVLQNGLVDR